MSVTTDYHLKLSPGDEVGTDPVLKCCGGNVMTTALHPSGGSTHTCVQCDTRADVDKHGVLTDIR
ncbi:hypothetical protein [Streptomyces sp. Ac-502]|uniref:hypothetical protein n=1 Tax=Streptomyces sp. Ac-502 TaxID=3342801 RepID=UPI003862CC19